MKIIKNIIADILIICMALSIIAALISEDLPQTSDIAIEYLNNYKDEVTNTLVKKDLNKNDLFRLIQNQTKMDTLLFYLNDNHFSLTGLYVLKNNYSIILTNDSNNIDKRKIYYSKNVDSNFSVLDENNIAYIIFYDDNVLKINIFSSSKEIENFINIIKKISYIKDSQIFIFLFLALLCIYICKFTDNKIYKFVTCILIIISLLVIFICLFLLFY